MPSVVPTFAITENWDVVRPASRSGQKAARMTCLSTRISRSQAITAGSRSLLGGHCCKVVSSLTLGLNLQSLRSIPPALIPLSLAGEGPRLRLVEPEHLVRAQLVRRPPGDLPAAQEVDPLRRSVCGGYLHGLRRCILVGESVNCATLTRIL